MMSRNPSQQSTYCAKQCRVSFSRSCLRPCLPYARAEPSQANSSGRGFGQQTPTPVTATEAQLVEILPREKVLDACKITSAAMAVLGVTGCLATPPLLKLVGSSIESISRESLLALPSPSELLIAAGTGCVVTAARFALMLVWSDLKASTDASNLQVLSTIPEMRSRDIALVASLPAATEEILFRGAVVGNLGGTPGAVALAALIFGYLHISGPRNYASGVFAGAAGVAYGLVYISSGSVLAAAVAHAVGNVTSAASWVHTQPLEAFHGIVHPENADKEA
eukprot:jgi/Ulvmu1/480/UM001_0488.1